MGPSAFQGQVVCGTRTQIGLAIFLVFTFKIKPRTFGGSFSPQSSIQIRNMVTSNVQDEVNDDFPEYTYITHLIMQPPSCQDVSQMPYQALEEIMHRKLSQPMRRASPAPLVANDDVFVPKASPPRAWRYQLREVIILGVQGPSGAGKTSLARTL